MTLRWRALTARPRHIPLRVKLVLLMCALVTGALTSTGFAATTLLRHSLMNRVDEQLTTASHQIADEVARHAPGSRFGAGGALPGTTQPNSGTPIAAPDSSTPANPPADPVLPPSCAGVRTNDQTAETRLPSDYFVQVSDSTGVPTTCSSNPLNQSDRGPAIPTLAIAAVDAHHNKPFTVASRNGSGHWRVVASPRADGTGSVAVAIPLTGVTSTLNQLAFFDLGIGGVVVIVLAGLSYLAVRRSLRPLVDVEHTAAAIAAGDLSRRVPESDPRTEVGKLAGALNGMLSQIESAFRAREASEQEARTSEHRMRRFITDASHELRTPLTSIRGFAELYRMGAVPDEPDVDRVMTRIESEATRMGLLVDDLLLLARLDQQRPLERDLVDLGPIAADAAHDAHAVAPGRDVRLEMLTDEPVVVVGDDARLRQVVGNLVTNALTHTPESASVTVSLGIEGIEGIEGAADERFAVLDVADTGPGLSQADAERVFERFYRVEQSRSRANGGSGLGLSIVAALTAAHGGTVAVTTEAGKGSRFRIRLPLAAT
jgi:two-component system, OmpR family, sensor kinase